MYLFLMVLFMILMVVWLVFAFYTPPTASPAPDNRSRVAGVMIPWFCVLILGLVVFGAFGPQPVVPVAVPAR
jgi:uncharacterized membrane protein YozB (DUF420 family)